MNIYLWWNQKLMSLTILIYEIRGLGIAFIKNVILNGLEKVTIFVSEIVKIKDMNSNFFFDESIL